MCEPNIYITNSKFISIVDNVSVLQLGSWGSFYRRKFAQSRRSLIVSRRCLYRLMSICVIQMESTHDVCSSANGRSTNSCLTHNA